MSLAEFPRFVPWASVALVISIALASIAFLFGRVPSEKKQEDKVTTIIIDSWRLQPPRTVTDQQGRSATIQTLVTSVASRELNWVLKSHDQIERLGTLTSIGPHLQSPGIAGRVQGYKAVVAVGAASEELSKAAPTETQAVTEEEDRARKRAKQLRLWVHEAYLKPPPVMWLSLGVRKKGGSAPTDTSSQRMLVLIGIIDAQPGIDLSEALKKNLQGDASFPFNITNYTQFELGDTWAN